MAMTTAPHIVTPGRVPVAAGGRRIAILLMLAAMVLAALLAGLALRPGARHPVAARPAPVARTASAAALPRAAPPPVVPTILADLTPDQARASNAGVPIVAATIPVAPHFVYTGSESDREAALTCLAAAVLYEAGDDKTGEQAVAQVVLNRLRHPAFPKTVCGVVFQGSERPTGCQFTFTCDGAIDRPPAPAAWKRARQVADAALSGHADADVGTATHYHADWVVPYWRASLVKIAQVHTHIFYRWPGGWGLGGAFVGRPQPIERLDPRLVPLAGPELARAVAPGSSVPLPIGAAEGEFAVLPPPAPVNVPGLPRGGLRGASVRLADTEAGQFVLKLDAGGADGYATAARTLCKGRADCMVFGWINAERMPRKLPILPLGIGSMSFMYRKNSLLHSETALWNCRQVARRDGDECLPGT